MASAGRSSMGSGRCREAAADDDDGGFCSSVSVDPDSGRREIGFQRENSPVVAVN